jgi:nucleotide-binding universal stress UspA family protein
MKKIIIAFDGTRFSEGAFRFAQKIHEIQPVLLVGVFLPQTQLANLWSYSDGVGGMFIPMAEENETEQSQFNVDRFEKLCIANGMDFRIHNDFNEFALPELKKESKYADLLIVGSEVFYENKDSGWPGEYLEDVLHEMACPILLVPEKYEFPKGVLLAYDGTDDSVFAIKQFAQLLPELKDLATLLVYVDENANNDFPNKIQLEELLARHFSDLTFLKLEIDPKNYFNTWISEKKSFMLVCGSYGRSGLSLLFKHSFVRDIIAEHTLPVFIAHK